MEILWSWNAPIVSPISKRLNLLHNDVLHEIVYSSNNQLSGYTITKFPHSIPNTHWIEWECPANVVPNQYEQIHLAANTLLTTATLDSDHSLQFSPSSHPNANTHMAQLLWNHASGTGIAQNAPYSAVAWYHQNQFILLAFENNHLMVGNTYRVNNPQECLYFTLLPFHQFKLKPSELQVTLHADFSSPQGAQTKQVFSKLIPHTQFYKYDFTSDFPTPSVPPFPHFVHFLMQSQECALPVEN